jgi:hypothetical protein
MFYVVLGYFKSQDLIKNSWNPGIQILLLKKSLIMGVKSDDAQEKGF